MDKFVGAFGTDTVERVGACMVCSVTAVFSVSTAAATAVESKVTFLNVSLIVVILLEDAILILVASVILFWKFPETLLILMFIVEIKSLAFVLIFVKSSESAILCSVFILFTIVSILVSLDRLNSDCSERSFKTLAIDVFTCVLVKVISVPTVSFNVEANVSNCAILIAIILSFSLM